MHYQNDLTRNSMTGLTADADSWYLDAASWAGLCYNLDSDKSTEQFYIIPHNGSKVNIKYTTAPVFQEYDYDWKDDGTNSSGYELIGFFAEPYVAFSSGNLNNTSALSYDVDATKIAKLIIDTDENYILKVSETFKLDSNYSVVVDRLDIDGNKVYLKLMYDGKEINSSIVNVEPGVGGDWILKMNVFGENAQVMRLHVASASGAISVGLVEIDSIWLIDFMNPFRVESGVDATKISKLVIDTDKNYTLKTGSTLELDSRYSVVVDSLDISGNKVYLKLMYEGQEINSSVINVEPGVGGDWILNMPVFGENAQVMRLHVKNIFTGTESSLVDIGSIWLVDFMNPLQVESDVAAIKIAKLVIDTDERYTLKTGAILEIGDGYSIIVDQVDVSGNKVYLRLMHKGQELNSSIVNAEPGVGGDWILKQSVLNEAGTQILRVHVKSIYQGTESVLVEIDGIWMADYLNPLQVKLDDSYGRFRASGIDAGRLTYEATGINLTADMEYWIGRGISLKTEKNFNAKTKVHGSAADNDKFYLSKDYYEESAFPGIRSSVYHWDGKIEGLSAAAPGAGYLTYENFAAFYYDLDSDTQTETLRFNSISGNIDAGQMRYVTEPAKISYEYGSWGQEYYVMGFFGETYIPLNIVNGDGSLKGTPLKSEKMAKLVIDDDFRYTLKVGATLELGDGYELFVDRVDESGTKAYIRFLKDGQDVNSSIVSTIGSERGDWIFKQTILDENDVQVLRVHVKSIFQGTETDLVEIDGLWLIDYVNATELTVGDKIGIMKFQSGGDRLVFVNDASFAVVPGMNKIIANNMSLLSSEEASRAYFYVGHTGPENPVVAQSSLLVTPTGYIDQIESVSMMYASNDTLVSGQEKTVGFDSILIFSPATDSSWDLNEDYYFLAKVKSGYTFVGNDFTTDSSGSGRTSNFNLQNGPVSKMLTVKEDDVEEDKMVYGLVWNDSNQNGIHDTDESMLPDVTVRLYSGTSGSGTLQKTAVSKADGSYQFSGVSEGDYYIEIVLPSDYIVSSAGASQSVDSTLRSASFNVKVDEPVEKNVGLFRSKTTTTTPSKSGGSGSGSAVISNGTSAASSSNNTSAPVKTMEKEEENETKETMEKTQDPPVSTSASSDPVSTAPKTNWMWPVVILSVILIGGAAVVLLWMRKK